jgi:glutaconyl-CoA/methylmalonyl-CoA decarboxylase subunit gamma
MMSEKMFEYNINGNKYVVEITNITAENAEVIVNGQNYLVELENPVADAPAVAAQPIAASAARPVAAQPPKPKKAAPRPQVNQANGELIVYAPLPGMVTEILATVGDSVSNGDTLLRMEAMKMENNITATTDGTVKEVHVAEGREVADGDLLVTIATS